MQAHDYWKLGETQDYTTTARHAPPTNRDENPGQMKEDASERVFSAVSVCTFIEEIMGTRFVLSGNRIAHRAYSCLLSPIPGDYVQAINSADGWYITHILRRREEDSAEANLLLPQVDTLNLKMPNINLVATRRIGMYAGSNCDISCPGGEISVSARSLFTTASENIVQVARNSLTQVLNLTQKAKGFLHQQSRHQLIGAEKEVRIDGEYINLG